MNLRYNSETDTLKLFFCDEVPPIVFDEKYEPGLISDDEDHFIGISILDASTKLPAWDLCRVEY
jgi:hypothetical protein